FLLPAPVWQRDHPVLKPGGHVVHCSFPAPPCSTFFPKNLYLKGIRPPLSRIKAADDRVPNFGPGMPKSGSPASCFYLSSFTRLLQFLDRVGPSVPTHHPLHSKLEDLWSEQDQAG